MLLLASLLAWCVTAASGLSCAPCGASPCSMTPPCCPSGEYTLDICGCCPVCAKTEGEKCGGMWNMEGICASGMRCARQQPSMPPLPPLGLAVHATFKPDDQMPGTCQYDIDGGAMQLTWSALKCHNEKKCLCGPALSRPASSGYEGGCQNILPTAGATHHAPTTDPYCFLENVQNYRDPKKDCFDDVEWSASQGKFYSHAACRPPPQCAEFCPAVYAPVCGADGENPPKFFLNTCHMELDACQTYRPLKEVPMSVCACAHDNEFIIGGNNIDVGGIFQTEGVTECAQRCSAVPDCKAWTLRRDTNTCWLKKSNHGTAPGDIWTWGLRCNHWGPHGTCEDAGCKL